MTPIPEANSSQENEDQAALQRVSQQSGLRPHNIQQTRILMGSGQSFTNKPPFQGNIIKNESDGSGSNSSSDDLSEVTV